MKTLWIVSDEPNQTYQQREYKLGTYNPDTETWIMNSALGNYILAALFGLKWGDPNAGQVPKLTIETREG